MAEEFISEEIFTLLKEKYLFNHIHPNFMQIDDASLVFIYLRLLTVYDDVNRLVPEQENFHDSSISKLRHILRCLRPLGLAYLAPNNKDLLDKKKATRIITALHDKISSKYGKTVSQRIRQVIKKEQLSRTSQIHHKSVNQIEDQTALRKSTDLNTREEYQLPVERKIPEGRQIPRTPLKIEGNKLSVVEEVFKQPDLIVKSPPAPLPPPPMFEDSPAKIVCSNLQNASAYVLTPPTEFCDNSYNKHKIDSSESPSLKSNYENVMNCVSHLEKPTEESLSNKSLTYSENVDLVDSGVSYSSSEGSLEECDLMSERKDSCDKNKEERITNSDIQVVNDKLCLQNEAASTIIANEPSCIVKENRHAVIDKRRTYCISKIPNIAENIKENVMENSEEDLLQNKNKRRTYLIEPNFQHCRTEHNEVRERFGMEDLLKDRNKRRTYVIQQDKENKIQPVTELKDEKMADNENDLNKTVSELNSTVNSTALYIDIVKNDVSFIERGKRVFPRGRELCRTPPSLNSSFDPFNQLENLDKISSSVSSANKFITIPVTNTGSSDVYHTGIISSREASKDSTFIKSEDTSFVFDDSFALFPNKMEINGKVTDENKLNDTATVNLVTSSPQSDSGKDDNYDDIAFEKTEVYKQLRKKVSEEIHKDQISDDFYESRETETKCEEENTKDQTEKVHQNSMFRNKLVSEATEREASDIQSELTNNFDKKGKNKNTRTTRKVRKEVIELINEEEEITESEIKTLDSENCKLELSENKCDAKENVEMQLTKDFEGMDLHLKKKRGPKPKLNKLNCENVKKLEGNLDRIVSEEENGNYQQSENQKMTSNELVKPLIMKKPDPKLRNKDSNLKKVKKAIDLKKNINRITTVEEKLDKKQNEEQAVLELESVKQADSEELFFKPDFKLVKKLKKVNFHTDTSAIKTENLSRINPARSKRTQNKVEQLTENLSKPSNGKSDHLERENDDSSSIKVSDSTKIKKKSQRIASKISEILTVNLPKHTSVGNYTTEENINIENKPSGIDENLKQKEKRVSKNRTSKVALMIEKFDNMKVDTEESNMKAKTRQRKKPEFENKENLEIDACGKNTDFEKSVAKTKYRNKSEIDSKEDIANNNTLKEGKESIKTKTRGRQTKKLEIDNDQENETALISDQESKPKHRRKYEIKEINGNIVEDKAKNVPKKPLLEVNESNEVSKRPSRKCKSYAKIAISDMLNSPSEGN